MKIIEKAELINCRVVEIVQAEKEDTKTDAGKVYIDGDCFSRKSLLSEGYYIRYASPGDAWTYKAIDEETQKRLTNKLAIYNYIYGR